MTGSGAAVFGVFASEDRAQAGAGGRGPRPRLVRHRPAAGAPRRAPAKGRGKAAGVIH